ncbi:flavodoxin family protein [Zoogloea oleivorans]|uniref:Flavodoxin family protein n=1 Tax=Zoogloea oleivorans TaxID=1552750 RepID=A0A6C2CCJ5_9RHOO|nr:NAD(P)H-dependent oxidoreductase [Zoogloea oleivorans]TYC51416.1 flavodoxin family protein [Zoogloea oleivorans]
MKVLIVHAHYEPQSFTTALKDQAVATLSAAGHEVRVSDLYAMQFNPVASAADFAERSDPDYCVYALEQRKGFESGTIAADIREEVAKVDWCDVLILNFPIFWFSVPAIMKGWIDRVFVSGRFYGGKRFYDQGGMRGKRALLSFTLGGREHMFGPQAIHGELETMLRPILRGSLAYAGFTVLPPFAAYHVPYVTQESRQQILVEYAGRLNRLDDLTSLSFPSLDDFDDRLYPKT